MPLNEDPDKPQAALDTAMEWMLRFRETADDPKLRADFKLWLSRTEENRAAWRQACKAWRVLGEVPPVYAHVWTRLPPARSAPGVPKGVPVAARGRRESKPRPEKLPTVGLRRRSAIGLAAIGIAACLLLLAAPSLMLRFEADHRTATAQSRIVTLEDGTTVHLAPDSAIRSDFSAQRRQVRLLTGEAFFDVARNADRPFVVDAGGVKVEVLGTAFDIRLASADARVELARGSVSVSYDASQNAGTTLSPGQMLVVDRGSGAVTKGDIAPDDIATWRDGRLFVNDATIGSVVEQIQRYHSAWIALPDPGLANQKVTGLYDLRDPDRALRALVQPHGGKMRELSHFARILSRF